MLTTRKRVVRVAIGVAAAAVCAATALGVATTAGATESQDSPARIIAQEKLAPLKEFRTPADRGWFYTLRDDEASWAVSRNGFRRLDNIGWLHTERTPGSIPVHRLRAKTDGPSYMLSTSPQEIGSDQFVDEGVLGFIDAERHDGETRLMRFSNHGQWRVLSDNPNNLAGMAQMGYTIDGPVGWYRP